MRRLAWSVAFVGVAGTALAGAIVGCGDDDATGATTGDGGASSSGATSSSGTTTSSSGGSSGTTSSSGGSSSGSTSGGTDGGLDAAAPNANKVSCGTTECDSTTQICCASPDTDGGAPDGGLGYKCQASGDTCSGAKVACDEKADCPGGTNVCCTNISGSAIASECKMTCGGSEVQLCKTTAECGDAGPCAQYSCPLGRKVFACTKPVGCN